MDWSSLHPDEIMRKYGEGWAVAYFFGICILAGLVLMVIIGLLSRAAHRRRKIRRSRWGHPHGLRLVDTLEMGRALFRHAYTDVGAKVLLDYPYYNLFKQPMAMSNHILEGTVDGMPCRVFEYFYITGSGKHTVQHSYSVVAFHYDRIKPHTALRRHVWRDGLSKEDILTGREEFDDKFYIYADDWQLFKNELPQELERLILDSVLYELFLADKTLLVVARGTLKDSGYDSLFADACRLAAFFKSKL